MEDATWKPGKQLPTPSFSIDQNNIHEELAQHAAIFASWSLYLAEVQTRKDRLEQQVETLVATAREEAREVLRERHGSKLTEKSVTDAVTNNPLVSEKQGMLARMVERERHAKAIIASLSEKTKMLQSYVGLRRVEIGAHTVD